ncbi:MAG: CBASS cGAMP-activated phospholipase [Hyphomicrobiales bacterium]
MFRILSLDGGGIKGAFTASVLAQLEADTGHSVIDHFDLITGTSTGGILAIGLGMGFSASELTEFYEESGPIIFPGTSKLSKAKGIFKQIFKPKHSQQTLKSEIEKILGDKKFGESKCRLVIPTYDAIAGRIYLLKTAHHQRFSNDIDAPAVDVALATSAAPTYFEAADFPTLKNASFVDGGLWANNPSLVGVVEAVHFLNIPLSEIDVLSIGTTTQPFSISENSDAGIASWNLGIVDVMFEGQMEAAQKQTDLLLNGRTHRINFMAKEGEFSIDKAAPKTISNLISLGAGEARKKVNLDVVKSRFLNGIKIRKFQPIHSV